MQNPINKIKNYAANVDKELGEAFAAGGKYNKDKTSSNKKNLQTQRSEFFGALTQGRRYEGGVKTTTATVNKLYRPSSDK